ncbi:hypothetical protein [Lentibacter sp.]|uniref:hypothetical protein n=1 Tax=Lentibacter sp. TaxID=2024994 RepID=UPI003F6B139A
MVKLYPSDSAGTHGIRPQGVDALSDRGFGLRGSAIAEFGHSLASQPKLPCFLVDQMTAIIRSLYEIKSFAVQAMSAARVLKCTAQMMGLYAPKMELSQC